jgi:hypothetical protein
MNLLDNTQEISHIPELYLADVLSGPRYTTYINKFPGSSATPIQKKYKEIIPASILRMYYHAYIPRHKHLNELSQPCY